MKGKVLVGLGVWYLSDGLYSWSLYHNAATYGSNAKQTFWRDHWIRMVRMILAVVVIAIGVSLDV